MRVMLGGGVIGLLLVLLLVREGRQPIAHTEVVKSASSEVSQAAAVTAGVDAPTPERSTSAPHFGAVPALAEPETSEHEDDAATAAFMEHIHRCQAEEMEPADSPELDCPVPKLYIEYPPEEHMGANGKIIVSEASMTEY